MSKSLVQLKINSVSDILPSRTFLKSGPPKYYLKVIVGNNAGSVYKTSASELKRSEDLTLNQFFTLSVADDTSIDIELWRKSSPLLLSDSRICSTTHSWSTFLLMKNVFGDVPFRLPLTATGDSGSLASTSIHMSIPTLDDVVVTGNAMAGAHKAVDASDVTVKPGFEDSSSQQDPVAYYLELTASKIEPLMSILERASKVHPLFEIAWTVLSSVIVSNR